MKKRDYKMPEYNKADLIDFKQPLTWMHSIERHDNMKGADVLKIAIIASLVIVSIVIIKAYVEL